MDGIAPPRPVTPPAAFPKITAQNDATAKKTAREFEAVFLGQMTQIMMETAQADGEFSGGHGEEMFRSVLAEKLGTEVAKRGGIGIAPMVMDQIIRLQGGSANDR